MHLLKPSTHDSSSTHFHLKPYLHDSFTDPFHIPDLPSPSNSPSPTSPPHPPGSSVEDGEDDDIEDDDDEYHPDTVYEGGGCPDPPLLPTPRSPLAPFVARFEDITFEDGDLNCLNNDLYSDYTSNLNQSLFYSTYFGIKITCDAPNLSHSRAL